MTLTSSDIKRVCVIGGGTMGAGIAAQCANAGVDVLLLDIKTDGDANAVAEGSVKRILESDPPLLMRKDNIERITVGNIEDNLAEAGACDWICEAIVERLDIKKGLYASLLPHLKPTTLVSSNTSTIPIKLLVEDAPQDFKERFCITHFFNPVRYMRLLELVKGEETRDDVISALHDFNDRMLGKGVVNCADTPGFLGNRVGVFALQAAVHEAVALGLDIEEADAIFGRPMGIPKTGAFGLYDLIGLDLMGDVVRSLNSILEQGDPFHEVGGENKVVNDHVARGFRGNKSGEGFYREKENGDREAWNLRSESWRPRNRDLPELALRGEKEGLTVLIEGDDKLSTFAWRVLARILTYSASLVPDVTHSPQDIDDAMKLGYNWVQGPFEMIDTIGSGKLVERLEAEGWHVPEFLRNSAGKPFYMPEGNVLKVRHWDGELYPVDLPDGVVRFHMTRRTMTPVSENEGASLFHLEDGVRLVEFHTKANALDDTCMAIVHEAANDPGPGIIVHNDAQHFSAGVNLERFLAFIEAEDWDGIDQFLQRFQHAVEALRYCNAPVVGAPSGLAIGGGYEVLAHCDKVVAHSNSVLGLVETTVGVVPGGGGVKETYLRWYKATGDWAKAARNTFDQIGYAQTASSPDEAIPMQYFVEGRDTQVMNRDRLIEGAKAALAAMSNGYKPRERPAFKLAGGAAQTEMDEFLEKGKEKGWFFSHDVMVASTVAEIMTGGSDSGMIEVDEREMFARERAAFIKLAKTKETHERIFSLLRNGTSIRN
ncbi:MAG: 3-hydroxyacyl-CoA dehydrogenase NAD-binding domain-containing protein [Rhizobiaceae bacterium]|nr:3-hydroxyacyl-CoA dehydrogenase NAD-binding domain-containing protein [Rhizobiaceae bacterium]